MGFRWSIAGALCAGLALGSVAGCGDELPGFARPPEHDAGAQPGADEDAGADEGAAGFVGLNPGSGSEY